MRGDGNNCVWQTGNWLPVPSRRSVTGLPLWADPKDLHIAYARLLLCGIIGHARLGHIRRRPLLLRCGAAARAAACVQGSRLADGALQCTLIAWLFGRVAKGWGWC